MEFIKKHLCDIPFCYAVTPMEVCGKLKYLFATDDTGPCYAIDAETFEKETVWDAPGGTMSIIPVPWTDNTFLASQKFLPGFSALDARIVKASYSDGGWTVTHWLELPYVHRFDIIESFGKTYFIACILSSTDKAQAEWDKPGCVIAAPIGEDLSVPMRFSVILDDMPRNHGYCRVDRDGYSQVYVSCDTGVYEITPPGESDGWVVRRLIDAAASDAAVCDIDDDGLEEIAVIEPFHGNRFTVYHRSGDDYLPCYSYPKDAPFLHAIWGGQIGGDRMFIAGYREKEMELFSLRYDGEQIVERVIETGGGPSNLAFCVHGGEPVMLVANRQSHEACLYEIHSGEAAHPSEK